MNGNVLVYSIGILLPQLTLIFIILRFRSRSAAAIKTIPGVCIDVSHCIEIKMILQ